MSVFSNAQKPHPALSEATIKQQAASDPSVSSWVGASAGSGKTKVLTDRVLRLLLPRESGEPGTRPEKILALTFTKTAANEMALRLSKRLSAWAVMNDEDLSKDMDVLLGRFPTHDEMNVARQLFARIVDVPGGLKIMTIHSFCQSVLGRFPIEAGLPANFKPLEEDQAKELLAKAKKETLGSVDPKRASPFDIAISNIGALMDEKQFSSVLQAIASERYQVEQILKRSFGIEGLYTNLCNAAGIPAGLSLEKALLDFCSFGSEQDLREASSCMAESKSRTDQEKSISIQKFWDSPLSDRPKLYNQYKGSFLTKEGNVLASAVTKPVVKSFPHILQSLTDEASRIVAFEELKKSIFCVQTTCDLFRIGFDVLERYKKLKELQAALDFDDLILRMLSLLKGEQEGLKGLSVMPWIMYKLDEGIDHILVDEAQDTNPEQWEIVRLLSDDFFNGLGSHDYTRSIFVVGDEKQSIFSFQRAAPEKFSEMHRWFEQKIRSSGETFLPVNINTSFRSVQIVLDIVDRVFEKTGDSYLNHIANREGQAGIVELWPIFQTRKTEKDDEGEEEGSGWFIPDKLVESKSGSFQMASRISETIRSWIDMGEKLESHNRPIQAGDIMVLVKSRNAFVGQLVRALKMNKIPVSGVDRMVLKDQLVVQDLCATASFALLPEDDLTLACLLKSPFIGMSEEVLYELSYNRNGTLWQSLRKSDHKDVVSWLEKIISRAGQDHPYEFFSRIVQEPCPGNEYSGIKAIRIRLGEDALDPLNEFLNTTLTYEASHSAGLQGFLKWTMEAGSEIKRQMEEGGGAVRIMTVHGAKGLQAPIVFLPDTVRVAGGKKTDPVLWPHKTGLDVPFYIPSKSSTPSALLPLQEKVDRLMDEEYYRLLYVAMTRAEDRLYIGGYIGKKRPSVDGKTRYWYENIKEAFEKQPDVERIPSGVQDEGGEDIPILRISSERHSPPDKKGSEVPSQVIEDVPLPPWIVRKAPTEPFPPRPLVPSRPSDPEPAAASPLVTGQEFRFRRGTVTHKLLQILPEIPKERRVAAAEHFLARPALDLPEDLQKGIAREVFSILDDPAFSQIFDEGSMAEVPVTGLLNENSLLSGQIDRVLIRGNEILIVDYKTNRPPPRDVSDVPVVYFKQMKAYADALRKIYPEHTVRCALLWTDGPRLMEIPLS